MKFQLLEQAFADVNGSSFVGIDTLTDVKLTGGKKNPMQGRITKQTLGANVMVFQNKLSNGYENMVHRRLAAEGKDPSNFELGPRTWGERIDNTPFIRHEHDGSVKHYLEVIFLKPGTSTYLLDGAVIAAADITGLPVAPEPTGQGGLEHQVIIRSFAASSITQVRVDGKVFK